MENKIENAVQQEFETRQSATGQREKKPNKARGYGRSQAKKDKHVGTQTVIASFKGTRSKYEFEIIIGKDDQRLKVHRVQIGRKPGENDTAWAIKSLGENKIKNIVMNILKKERHLRPLEVPIFSESLFL